LDAGWGLDPFAEDVLGKQIPLAQRPDPANDSGMVQLQLRLTLREDMGLAWPQACINDGWLTFGFGEDLTAATMIAAASARARLAAGAAQGTLSESAEPFELPWFPLNSDSLDP